MRSIKGIIRHMDNGDMRDFISIHTDNDMRLYPYAKDLFYHPGERILSMTIQIYDDQMTHDFSFGFKPTGKLKEFMDQLWDKEEGQ